MNVTREHVERRITDHMDQCGFSRPEAIEDLLYSAETGAKRAEKEVTLAEEALRRAETDEEIKKLESTIIREGRWASLERDQIAFLKDIAKEDKKKTQK